MAAAETVRKTFKYKLQPTADQQRELEAVVWHCRTLYNTALERRITWGRPARGVGASRFQQEAELKEVRAAFPEYAAIHSHLLHDVLAGLDTTYQAFFRRVQRGEQAGFPRFQGRERSHSFPDQEYCNGARRDNGYLVLSKIGRLAVRWARPLEGTPKTVTITRAADGWSVAISCAEGAINPLPLTRQETAIDLRLESFRTL